jgi:manganese/zinc/iron transport system permease protein
MATMTGVVFTLALLFAPEQGLVARWRLRRRQRWQFAGEMLLVHLSNHENTPEADHEASVDHMRQHMKWSPAFSDRVVGYLSRRGLANQEGNLLRLTDDGRQLAQEVMVR